MDGNLQVHKATPGDVQMLVGLTKDFYNEANFELDELWATDVFIRLLEHESNGCVWIALWGEKAIGHAVLTVRFTMEHGGPCAYVDDLFVEKDFRRRGAAHRLLAELEQESRRRNCKAIVVEVGKTNLAALRAYQKLGMQVIDDGRILYRKVLL